jgi:hypothetical protein
MALLFPLFPYRPIIGRYWPGVLMMQRNILWAPGDSPFSLSDLQADCTVLLLPEYDSDQEAIDFLNKIDKGIFEIELDSYGD